VIPRLLERDHRRGAAGVTDMGALDVRAAAQAADEVRVDARREPGGAGRGHDEIDVGGVPARSLERPAGGGLRQGPRAVARAARQPGDAIVRSRPLPRDPQITALDVATLATSAPR